MEVKSRLHYVTSETMTCAERISHCIVHICSGCRPSTPSFHFSESEHICSCDVNICYLQWAGKRKEEEEIEVLVLRMKE